jgi:hypothetical protein
VSDTASGKQRWRVPLWAKIVIGIVILLAVATVVPRLYVRYRIHQELAAVRKAGQPVTMQELLAWYPKPDGKSGAEEFSLAIKKFATTPNAARLPIISYEPPLPWGQPLSAETLAGIAEYVKANDKALALLHEANRKGLRLSFSMTERGDIAAYGQGYLERAAHLLTLQAMLRAEGGDAAGAAQSVRAILGASMALKFVPLDKPDAMPGICRRLAVYSLNMILSRNQLPDDVLRNLAAQLAEAEDPEMLKRAYIGQRCWLNYFLSECDSSNEPIFTYPGELWGRVAPFIYRTCDLRSVDRLAALQTCAQWIEAVSLPWPQPLHSVKEPDLSTRRMPLRKPWTTMWFAGSTMNITSEAEDTAFLRTARAAMAVEKYRLAKGKLPESLDELIPDYASEVPRDPFDGKPLRYRKGAQTADPTKQAAVKGDATGYVIYSIGRNRRDEGGGAEPDDPSFIVPR